MSDSKILNFNFLTDARGTLNFARDDLSDFNFNITKFSLPNISSNTAKQPTPFLGRQVPGEHMVFGNLDIEFLVQEDLSNWLSIFNWMIDIYNPNGFPKHKNVYSDVNLILYTSKNNPYIKIKFLEAFPIQLGQIDFSSQSNEDKEIAATASFSFHMYEIEVLNVPQGSGSTEPSA